jgi:hypothetical protein
MSLRDRREYCYSLGVDYDRAREYGDAVEALDRCLRRSVPSVPSVYYRRAQPIETALEDGMRQLLAGLALLWHVVTH